MNSETYFISVSWKSIYDPSTNQDTATFRVNFASPIILDPTQSYEMTLASLDSFFSIPNVITNVNNNLTYNASGTTKSITFPQGCYDINTIDETLQSLLKVNGDAEKIKIGIVAAQLKSSLTIATNYSVDFTVPNSINTILGFKDKVLNAGTQISDSIVNISKTNTIYVNCDLISSSYVNGINQPVIYSFYPSVPPGYKIIVENNRMDTYLPVNRSQISGLTVWLTDQNGQNVNFNGEIVSIRFIIRKKNNFN